MVFSARKELPSIASRHCIELVLIAIGMIYLLFAGIKCLAAERGSDQTIEHTQLQLEYFAGIASPAASKTRGKKVNLIHIIRIPDLSDNTLPAYNKDALRKLTWNDEFIVNEWGGHINVFGVDGKLTIEYDGVPDNVCSNKLFDYATKSYDFKCNGKWHQTKIVGAIQHHPFIKSSLE